MIRRHGYLLVLGTPLERTGMDKYQSLLPPIYKQHSGYRLVMGGQTGGVSFLSGGLKNLSVMLARFPSPEDVSGFWWSDDYRDAYTVRKKAGRFAAVGLAGVDKVEDPIPGARGYLVAMAAAKTPGCWRRFADPFLEGIERHKGTVLADSGPEGIERLENLMPGSHIIVAMFSDEQAAQDAWAALAPTLQIEMQDCEPVTIIALSGLENDHPWRLTDTL
ncbi:MAG: DUF1330 domain-containing protein [Rhodospirillaceae bacterium]